MTVRYETRRPDDRELRQRMKAIPQERRRFDYWRLLVMLRRECLVVNHKKLFRLYREEKLAVRRRGGRKRAIGTWAPMVVPLRPDERWSLDFVSDQLTDGRRFRILAVCQCRLNTPQKCRLNLPQYSAVAGLPERVPGDRRRVIVDASPDGRERDFGGQDRGDDDDTGFASAGPVGVGDRQGQRDRPQDGAQIH